MKKFREILKPKSKIASEKLRDDKDQTFRFDNYPKTPKVDSALIKEIMAKEEVAFADLVDKAKLTADELEIVSKVRRSLHESKVSLRDYAGKPALRTELKTLVSRQKYGESFLQLREGKNEPDGRLLLWGLNAVGKTFAWRCLMGQLAEEVRLGKITKPILAFEVSPATFISYENAHEHLGHLLDGILKLAGAGGSVFLLLDQLEDVLVNERMARVFAMRIDKYQPILNLCLIATSRDVWNLDESVRMTMMTGRIHYISHPSEKEIKKMLLVKLASSMDPEDISLTEEELDKLAQEMWVRSYSAFNVDMVVKEARPRRWYDAGSNFRFRQTDKNPDGDEQVYKYTENGKDNCNKELLSLKDLYQMKMAGEVFRVVLPPVTYKHLCQSSGKSASKVWAESKEVAYLNKAKPYLYG